MTSLAAEVEERQHISVERLYDLLKDQGACLTTFVRVVMVLTSPTGDRLRSLEEDNRRLSETLGGCLEDLNSLRHTTPRPSTVSQILAVPF